MSFWNDPFLGGAVYIVFFWSNKNGVQKNHQPERCRFLGSHVLHIYHFLKIKMENLKIGLLPQKGKKGSSPNHQSSGGHVFCCSEGITRLGDSTEPSTSLGFFGILRMCFLGKNWFTKLISYQGTMTCPTLRKQENHRLKGRTLLTPESWPKFMRNLKPLRISKPIHLP